MNKRYSFYLLVLTCFSLLQAQVSINTSGSTTTNSNGSISIAIGQLFQTYQRGTDGASNESVLQCYEIDFFGDLAKDDVITLIPRPAINNNNFLFIEDTEKGTLVLQVVNTLGQVLINKPIRSQKTKLNFSSVSSGAYFVHVIKQNGDRIRTFKMIKNN